MRFIFLNQFYPPDLAPTGMMLAAVTAELSKDGHECEVWCSGGSYGVAGDGSPPPPPAGGDAAAGGVRVRRIGRLGAGKSFFAKLRGWLGFYLVLGARLMLTRERPDVIVAMTTPPFLSVLARMAAWRHGARHAHWVMDLYPDVLAAHGMLKESGWVYQGLAGLARWGFGGKRAGAVLTLGPCMVERVERLMAGGGDSSSDRRPPAIQWVPLWGTGGGGASGVGGPLPEMGSSGVPAPAPPAAAALRRARGWGADEVVVLYSGNLGRGHLVAPMLQCALEMAGGSRRLRWVFCAHGARLDEVKRFASEHPEVGVEFLEPVPSAQLHAHLASADVHLASLNETWTGCMVPSKLQGIFAVGRPVVFLGSRESSIGQWVAQSGGGWVVAPADARGLRSALEEAGDPTVRQTRGEAAGRFAKECFDQQTNVRRVAEILAG